MLAMLLDQPRQPLRAADLPMPRPNPEQILLRVNACGVCRTDLHVVDGELTEPKLPLIPGHEIVGTVVEKGERVVVRHLYTERRVTPLNLYLKQASAEEAQRVALDYGTAIKDLAGADIFTGDMLLKNFGVTRHGRVICYDYDELALITECNFREIPRAADVDEEMAAAGIAPRLSELQPRWAAQVDAVLREATLQKPANSPYSWHGKRGVHTEHLGHMLTEMQHLQRHYPGAQW